MNPEIIKATLVCLLVMSAMSDCNEYLPQKFMMDDGNYYVEVKTNRNMNGWAPFDFDNHVFYKHGRMDKRKKARYMRIKSGMRLAKGKKERLDFLTLTTQYDKSDYENRLSNIGGMNHAFDLLKKKIEYFWQKTLYLRVCKKNHLVPWGRTLKKHRKKRAYPEIWDKCKTKFKYFKVKTSEGGGVMHILFRKGVDVPQINFFWLQRQWSKLWHGSWDVNISEVDVKDTEKMSMYWSANIS